MNKIFMLVNCDLGSEDGVKAKIEQRSLVRSVEKTYGVYDLMVELEGEERQVKDAVLQIRKLPYVRSAVSLISYQ